MIATIVCSFENRVLDDAAMAARVAAITIASHLASIGLNVTADATVVAEFGKITRTVVGGVIAGSLLEALDDPDKIDLLKNEVAGIVARRVPCFITATACTLT